MPNGMRALLLVLAILGSVWALGSAYARADVLTADLRRACSVYAPGIIVGALQHGEEGDLAGVLRESAAEAKWGQAFAGFVRSGAPARLLAAAEAEARLPQKRKTYSRQVCRRLSPVLAAAATAEIMAANGIKVPANPLLVSCPSGRCLAPAVAAIGERCAFQPFELPLKPVCP